MKVITVNASKCYDVVIGSGLLDQLSTYVLALKKPCRAAIITDSNVQPLYSDTVIRSLSDAGFDVVLFAFPAGEASKNQSTYFDILNFLAENGITRSDLIVALGGGVVGDIAGFSAATYLRGVPYIQIPTTLLAMVDSSVGGKTAIDLPAGKNLAGAFYQPSLVVCDIDTLKTLPESIFRDGCAEVIKYGVLYDGELFFHLSEHGLHFNREKVIAECVDWKRKVVCEDEYDTGARQKLNLGHTIGHGIEAKSHFSVSHGQAVAIGMALVSKASAANGFCGETVHQQICSVLRKFDLPVTTDYAPEELYHYALSDKKRSGNVVNLIIPRNIGDCEIYQMPVSEMQSFIKAGLL